MRFERTSTYNRLMIWRFIIQFSKYPEDRIKRRSTKTICHMIEITNKLTFEDKKQYRDYLNAVLRDEECQTT